MRFLRQKTARIPLPILPERQLVVLLRILMPATTACELTERFADVTSSLLQGVQRTRETRAASVQSFPFKPKLHAKAFGNLAGHW